MRALHDAGRYYARPELADFTPRWPGPDATRTALRRHRIAFNRGCREWLLAIGRERRRQMRLNPPVDYDCDLPF